MYKLWNVPYRPTQGAAIVLSEHTSLDEGVIAYDAACEKACSSDNNYAVVLTEPAGIPVCGA